MSAIAETLIPRSTAEALGILADWTGHLGLDIETLVEVEDEDEDWTRLELGERIIGIGLTRRTAPGSYQSVYLPLRHRLEAPPKLEPGKLARYEAELARWRDEKDRAVPRHLRRWASRKSVDALKPRPLRLQDMLRHEPYPDNLDPRAILTRIAAMNASQEVRWACHNGAFEMRALGIETRALGLSWDEHDRWDDSMLLTYAGTRQHRPGKSGRLALDSVAWDELGERKDEEALAAFWADRGVKGGRVKALLAWSPVPVVARYCGHDSALALRLVRSVGPLIAKNAHALRVYRRERSLVRSTVAMEDEPKAVNLGYVEERIRAAEAEAGRRAAAFRAAVKSDVNPDSPAELGRALFRAGVRLPITPAAAKKIESGSAVVDPPRQTNEHALKDHRDHPAVKALMDYRWIVKRAQDFKGILRHVVRQDGIAALFPRFSATTALTGRYGGSKPNFQNKANDEEEDGAPDPWSVRRSIVPVGPDWLILSLDLSQIEPRVAAHITGDPVLIRVYRDGLDVYVEFGRTAWPHIDPDLDWKEWKARNPKRRKQSKGIQLGIFYGAGGPKIAEMAGLSEDEAALVLARIRLRFSRLFRYQEWLGDQYAARGYVVSPMGRTIRLRTRSDDEAEAGLHALFNYMIQGTAADLLKEATVRIRERLRADGMLDRVRIAATIHDELLFNVHESALEYATRVLPGLMTDFGLKIPLAVDLAASRVSWADMTEWKPGEPIPWEKLDRTVSGGNNAPPAKDAATSGTTRHVPGGRANARPAPSNAPAPAKRASPRRRLP